MNQRLLLGSTALVGAGILLAGAAPARAQGATPMTVTLSGYTEVGLRASTGETNFNGVSNTGYKGFMDTEVHIQAQATTDSGLTYGSYVAMDLFQPEDQDSGSNVHTDEANLFFAGGFGRTELGRQDGAEDVMFVGAEDAQSGTGGIDGDTQNLVAIYHVSFDDSAKVTYFTPRFAGFQLGASAIPDESDNGGIDTNGNFNEAFTAGANWVGAMGGLDLTLSAVAGWAKNAGRAQQGAGFSNQVAPGNTSSGNLEQYAVGGLLGVGGLSFGVTAGQSLSFNQANFANAGLKYKFGGASASVGYAWMEPDHGKTQNFFVVSGDVGLMPGVTLKGDVSYNDNDPFKHTDGTRPGDTTSGVVSVQLDY